MSGDAREPDGSGNGVGGEPSEPEGVRAAAPSPDADQQPGFKVVSDEPRSSGNKMIWIALIVAVVILAGYAMGAFR